MLALGSDSDGYVVMVLDFRECWLDVTVLFAGLEVPAKIELASDVSVEQILQANVIAQAVKTASEVTLGLPSYPDEPMRPVCGLRYRVRGRREIEGSDGRFNTSKIMGPQQAFVRAVTLIRGRQLTHGGTFVTQEDNAGNRRVHGWQFNAGTLSVNYSAEYFSDEHADELRQVFAALRDLYMTTKEGLSIGTAIDRLGAASTRSNPVDTNLDLCIAAEIAFLFGLQDRIDNQEITKTIREHARLFFGDDEFFWDRNTVFEIVEGSYRERGHTIHGRRGDHEGRYDVLTPLNVRLREVLKASLRAYIERKPTNAIARPIWPARSNAFAAGALLGPIFVH